MLSKSEINNCPRDDHPRGENLLTQPLFSHRVFNEPYILTKGWYPICPSKALKQKEARSFTILKQRIVVYRGESNEVFAADAFCPHMGADLGNGEVIGNNIRCFFHHWEFDKRGNMTAPACLQNKVDSKKTNISSYPTQEKYNYIWVFGDSTKTHDVPNPPGLKNDQVKSFFFKKVKLFAHHHVMMTNGIDLQHFKSVHNLDIQFDCKIEEYGTSQFEWELEGEIPTNKLFLRMARVFMGSKFRYKVLFSGGTITSITYGFNQKWKGVGRPLPSIHILWGATPTIDGVSEVDIFFIFKKYRGLLAPFKSIGVFFLSMLVLGILKDDDIKAFPHMRYNVGQLTPEDHSIAKFIQLTNKLEISRWTN